MTDEEKLQAAEKREALLQALARTNRRAPWQGYAFVLQVTHQHAGKHKSAAQVVAMVAQEAAVTFGLLAAPTLRLLGLGGNAELGCAVWDLVTAGLLQAEPRDDVRDFQAPDVRPLLEWADELAEGFLAAATLAE